MDVQKENGYTPIANQLLEQLCKINLNGTQFRMIMVIWRMTYGFSRKSHELSVGFIAKAMGTDTRTIKRELNRLIEMNIITIVKEATFNSSRVIGFNKNFDIWVVNSHQVINLSPVDNITTSPGGENGKNLVVKLPPKKEIEIKTINKDKCNFQQIIDLYNEICVSLPKVTKLSEARKKAIKARLKEYSEEDLRRLFIMAEQSDFLTGKNNSNWNCSFDWLMKDSNIVKVLDGNYSNKGSVRDARKLCDNGFGHVKSGGELMEEYRAAAEARGETYKAPDVDDVFK